MHSAAADRCGFGKNFLPIPLLLLTDCFATTVSGWDRGIYTSSIFFKNIYFFENKDRHLTVSSHKTSDVCFQAGAFLTVFIGLTKDAFYCRLFSCKPFSF